MQGRKVLLGVTGGIAAYKSALLTRLLVKAGAEVRVIMTAEAEQFITPLTLGTLSKNPVLKEFAAPNGQWNNHVELGLWADAMVIAPATANTLAKMACGMSDNLLLAAYLSARCPVFFAPAMDLDMLQHPATQANINTLTGFGNILVPPAYGELASGLVGTGRMAEPDKIAASVLNHFERDKKLIGRKALVTAGPTYEALDPVRFIGNHASGKMGFALAEALVKQGAEVHLVAGPTQLQPQHPGIQITRVVSAEEMHTVCNRLFSGCDIAVLSAAVADYKPATTAGQKIKKTDSSLTLELVKTHDIAASLGAQKKNGQLLVGFALETENEVANAKKKIKAKNFDLIVLNSLNDSGAGFGYDTNRVTLIDRNDTMREFPLKSKQEVAADIVTAIIRLIHA
jgi:phosphopantothenoylcysteine decarboxylase/phosphopantothenate--cysteine ligase